MKEEILEIKEKVLELKENKKYSELQQYIEQLTIQDLALLFEDINDEDMIKVFRLLPKDEAADVFSYIDPDLQEKLIYSFRYIKIMGKWKINGLIKRVKSMIKN